jgi:hypothetical protein
MIGFADPARILVDPTAGNMVLRRMPRTMATLVSVKGAHGRETDGAGWWHWVAGPVTYKYRIIGKPTRIRFAYVSIAEGSKALKVAVQGGGLAEFRVTAREGWNEFISPPLALGESPELSITIAAEGKPVKISAADARVAAFMIKNLEVLQEDGAAAK